MYHTAQNIYVDEFDNFLVICSKIFLQQLHICKTDKFIKNFTHQILRKTFFIVKILCQQYSSKKFNQLYTYDNL